MYVQVLSVLALAASTAVSSTAHRPRHVLHEKRGAVSLYTSPWRKVARVDPHAVLPIRIGLAQSNLEKGHDYLMSVSDPNSPSYGKHWSMEEVHNAFAPPREAIEMIKEWLIESGIQDEEVVHSDNKGWLAMDIPAGDAERLFKAEYYEHEHTSSGNIRIGCDEYHIPYHIQHYVDYVTPGVKFSASLKKRTLDKRSQFGGGSSKPPPCEPPPPGGGPYHYPPGANSLPPEIRDCGRNITPACIKALYHIPDATRNVPGHTLGIYENGDTYAQSDLDAFYKLYSPNVPQGTYPIPAFVDGAKAPVAADSTLNTGESDIDLTMAYSLIYPQQITLYQVDDAPQAKLEASGGLEGFLNTWLDALDGSYCNYTAYGITGDSQGIDASYPDKRPGGYHKKLQCGVYKPTNVLTVSYGEAESDLPDNYIRRQCNEFMKLGLQGHTFFFSSSDYGVASYPGDGSRSGCMGKTHQIFNPDYPSGCPYVTVVGATMLYANQTVLDRESALHVNLSRSAQNFSSAGGFSNVFSVASYQQSAVSQYFQNYNPPYQYYTNGDIGANGGIYNRNGRGYPDVSANGAHFRAFTNGTDYYYYGTSLAAPLWASLITLINQERAVAGKGPVGFINPALYANPGVFNDIINGTNPGCGTEGFKAVPGWDPITGLGTPDYPKLLNLFMSMK